MIAKEEILVLPREKCKVINVKFLCYFSMYQITVMKCVIQLERHCHPVSVCGVIALEALTLRRRIKSHLLFAGIIRSSPFSPR